METRLSIAHDIVNFWNAKHDRAQMLRTFTQEDFFARHSRIYLLIHMLRNEDFIVIWSPTFIYMSFDSGFRFEYDEVEFPKD